MSPLSKNHHLSLSNSGEPARNVGTIRGIEIELEALRFVYAKESDDVLIIGRSGRQSNEIR